MDACSGHAKADESSDEQDNIRPLANTQLKHTHTCKHGLTPCLQMTTGRARKKATRPPAPLRERRKGNERRSSRLHFCPDGIYPSARQPVARPRLDNKVYEHCKVEGFAMYVEQNQPRQTNNGGRRVSLGRSSSTSEAGPTFCSGTAALVFRDKEIISQARLNRTNRVDPE